MPDPADLPDPDVIYARTVESRRQFGIEAPSREHVEQLVESWNRLIVDGQDGTRTTH
jgi:hypothetical protein